MTIVPLGRAAALAMPIILATACASQAQAERRVALVVGNSNYRHVPTLPNPENDARLIAGALTGAGFALVGKTTHIDLDKAQFDAVVQQFGAEAQGADVALFYFAGHGMQLRGNNYLVPVTANPTREADADFQLVDVNLVLRQMEASGTRLNIIMLDACRNNPFSGRGVRSSGAGLAQIQAPEGTLISFATQPGNVALDGTGANSPYTKALAEIIQRPDLGIFDAFNAVGLAVRRETGGAQLPWVSSSPITGTFRFSTQTASVSPAQPPPQAIPQPAIVSTDWISSEAYQRLFGENLRLRYYPRIVEARAFPQGVLYRADFERFPDGQFAFASHHGLLPKDFAARDEHYRRDGYVLVHRQSIRFDRREFVQGVWTRR